MLFTHCAFKIHKGLIPSSSVISGTVLNLNPCIIKSLSQVLLYAILQSQQLCGVEVGWVLFSLHLASEYSPDGSKEGS